jgi:hypothetical protein
MNETKFKELTALLHAGQQWRCQLMFPLGSEDAVNLCDYLHRDFLGEHAQTIQTASFPSTSRYRFSPDLYGDGIKSVDRLRKDLVEAAKQSGFVLVTCTSKLKRSPAPFVVFSCSRHETYRSTRGKRNSYTFSADKVTADDVKEQKVTVRRNKTKRSLAFSKKKKSKAPQPSPKHPAPMTPAKKRRNATTRAVEASQCCPFSFRVFLHSDGMWYLFMSVNKLQAGVFPNSHCFHDQLSSSVTRTSSRYMSYEELEKIRQHNSVHLSTSLSAHLLSTVSDNLWLPSQVSYVCNKTKQLVADLNKSSSSADRLLSFLRNTKGVSYIVLTDDGNGGLLAKRGKGRPRAPLSTVGVEQKSAADEVTLPVPSSYCSEQSNLEVSAMRKGMTLSENQKLLLMVCWVTDVELRLVQMYPEVFFMDVTAETNNEGRGLFLVAGKDGNNSGFTAARIFLPSEQMWVFQWIFDYALPTLFSPSVIQANHLCVTDGDKQVYHPLNQLQLRKEIWRGNHQLCEFHLLVIAWRKKVLPFVLDDAPTEAIAVTAYQWIQTWFWNIESEAEFKMSLDDFYAFLDRSRTEANTAMLTAIRNFVLQSLLPLQYQWLRCHFLYKRSLDAKANSVVESQNSSLKHGTVKVSSSLGIETSTQRMTDYANLLHNRKSVSAAGAVTSTPLWSASGTAGWLTNYAEGLICSNMDRRLLYKVTQGTCFPWLCLVLSLWYS